MATLALIKKEFADFISSPKFLIVFAIFSLVMFVSAYTGIQNFNKKLDKYQEELQQKKEIEETLGKLPKIFSIETPRPSVLSVFMQLSGTISLLGGLLGLILGYDMISKERKGGTLRVLLSYPLYRDSIINGKFISGALVLTMVLISIVVVSVGIMITLGLRPTSEEVIRIAFFEGTIFLYMLLFLSAGILFSIIFKEESSSLFASLITWVVTAMIFTSLLYVFLEIVAPIPDQFQTESGEIDPMISKRQHLYLTLSKVSPTTNFNQISNVLLSPYIPFSLARTVGPPEPATLAQSLSYAWSHLAILLGFTAVTFTASYIIFMRQDIR